MALLLLGVTPFLARLMPASIKPNPDSVWQGTFYGFICMGLMLMTGVSGPLMDTFFLGGNFGRREIVATKATCQVASHFTKLIYFGGIIDQAATLDPVLAGVAIAASMLGTTLARRILEAMSDAQFRTWAGRLITTVAGYYILYGGWLLFTRADAMAFWCRPAAAAWGAGVRRDGPIVRCAVQYPEQRSPPARPVQFPRPESPVSLPEPDADLSCTVTEARTAPDLATCPVNLTRLGCVTTPSFMFTEKL